MFVHEGFFHLFGNMIFLFLFGSCVEDMIGRLRFTIFYVVGGLIAEFAYMAMSPAHFRSMVPMGGASGAISACMGMYLLLRADADIEFKYFFGCMSMCGPGNSTSRLGWPSRSGSPKTCFSPSWACSPKTAEVAWRLAPTLAAFLGGLALVAAYQWLARCAREIRAIRSHH